METARQKAIEMWKATDATHTPPRRDGLPISNDDITWLPVMDSMQVKTQYNRFVSLGTVGELLKVLEKVQREMDKK